MMNVEKRDTNMENMSVFGLELPCEYLLDFVKDLVSTGTGGEGGHRKVGEVDIHSFMTVNEKLLFAALSDERKKVEALELEKVRSAQVIKGLNVWCSDVAKLLELKDGQFVTARSNDRKKIELLELENERSRRVIKGLNDWCGAVVKKHDLSDDSTRVLNVLTRDSLKADLVVVDDMGTALDVLDIDGRVVKRDPLKGNMTTHLRILIDCEGIEDVVKPGVKPGVNPGIKRAWGKPVVRAKPVVRPPPKDATKPVERNVVSKNEFAVLDLYIKNGWIN